MAVNATEGGPLRFFAGNNEDGSAREYKRWKVWVQNKLLTMGDKIPDTAHGAYVHTLLSGKALECVEHLEPSEYQKKGGEKVIFTILDQRYPEQEKVDELGEMLSEVFALRSQEGGSLRTWASCATEIFDRCHRKTGVTFPEEAKGLVLLHWSGLNDERKAVVRARAQGDLRRAAVGAALRSCFPDFVFPKKKHFGINLAEQPPEFAEDDVREVLAATWKEKRAELNRLQKEHQFSRTKGVKRSFRIEVEELKKPPALELDSGCGRSIIGADTLMEFEKLWQQRGFNIPEKVTEIHHFRYGNGEQETSRLSVKMPVVIAERSGIIKAAIVKGRAPLLISRVALRALQAKINFHEDSLTIFEDQKVIPLTTNSAGQYVLNLLDDGPSDRKESFEVMVTSDQPAVPLADDAAKSDPNVSVWTREDWDLVRATTSKKGGESEMLILVV
ncbi:unnamed protein product [Effrenium voratum]|nr:unnamed protein product [Effrenium voratum]